MRLGADPFFCLFLACSLATGLCPAQGRPRSPSQIQPGNSRNGAVTDPSGAAIAHAHVRLASPGQPAFQTQTDDQGTFQLPAPAQPETAILTVEAPGFGTYSDTVVLSGEPGAGLSIHLNLALAVSSVEVDGDDGTSLDPANTQMGSTLNRTQLALLPVMSRSFTDLLAISPGVVPSSSAQPNAVVMSGVASTPPSGDLDLGALSVNGQRETANAFRVNGSDVQEDVNMGVAIVPTLDSIADLQVLTSSFDARLGNGSGAHVAVETRSGGARTHGSTYVYFRDTALDARNYFSLNRAPFHKNQFGGTLGGPVSHAPRLFFFADYQGTRQAQGIDTGLIAVPTLADRTGNLLDGAAALTGEVSGGYFAQQLSSRLGYAVQQGEPYYDPGCTTATCVFPGAVIPKSAFSTPAQHLLPYIPSPNQGASTFSTSLYPQRVRDDKGSIRLDRATPLGALSGYGFLDDYTVLDPYPTGQGGATVPGFNAQNKGRAQLYAANLVTTFGANATNAAHLSYMRNAASVGQPQDGVGTTLASQGFVTGVNTPGIVPLSPQIEGVENVIFNSFTLGTDVTSLSQAENIFELAEDGSRTIGTHTVSLGAAFHADQINTHPSVYDNGSFSFTGSETGSDFADFLLGIDSSYTQGQGQPFYNRNHYLGLYAQDSWRVRPQLTLNYGLRWDFLPPWSEKFNQLLTLDPNEQSLLFPNAPKGILFPGDPGVPNTISPTRHTDLAPRVAASWQLPKPRSAWVRRVLGTSGATVFRAGFGLYYTAFEGLSAGIMSGNPPYGFTDTSAAPTLFDRPFITAATGVFVGQRFPLQQVAFGASSAHPNTSVDWSNFEPLTGIPAFARDNVTPYAENYSISAERQLGLGTVLTASYVGTQAHHLLVIQEANPGNASACLALSTPAAVAPGSATCGPFGESSTYRTSTGQTVAGTRTAFNAAFGSVNLQRTIANSHDNALELSLRHSTRALFLQIGYTWSQSIDQSSSLAEAVDPGDAGRSRALSAFDLTQNFVAAYRYQLPLGSLLRHHPRLAEGWQVSGLTRFSTGFPVTLVNNNDTSLLGTQPNGINNNGVDEPDFAGGTLKLHHRPSANTPAFDASLFSMPALGTLGSARRRFFHGPGADNTDLALAKSTQLQDRSTLELRVEAFNAFNHGQFFGPASVSGNISSTNFGQIQSSSPPRLLQFAARIKF